MQYTMLLKIFLFVLGLSLTASACSASLHQPSAPSASIESSPPLLQPDLESWTPVPSPEPPVESSADSCSCPTPTTAGKAMATLYCRPHVGPTDRWRMMQSIYRLCSNGSNWSRMISPAISQGVNRLSSSIILHNETILSNGTSIFLMQSAWPDNCTETSFPFAEGTSSLERFEHCADNFRGILDSCDELNINRVTGVLHRGCRRYEISIGVESPGLRLQRDWGDFGCTSYEGMCLCRYGDSQVGGLFKNSAMGICMGRDVDLGDFHKFLHVPEDVTDFVT